MPEDGSPAPRLRKPANTAFKQQRLKAWQPILTPRTVLPTFFILGLIFIPLGVGLYFVSESVQEYVFDYTACTDASAIMAAPDPNLKTNIRAWSFDQNSKVCKIQFELKSTMKAPVFLYYRLTNFYQNHRRYVKSVSSNQLLGEAVDAKNLADCSPLTTTTGASGELIYYPCGLIANSMFNDNIGASSNPLSSFQISNMDGGNPYTFSCKGIAWPSDAQKFGPTKYDLTKIAPPKDWKKYNNGTVGATWATSGVLFNPSQDEHFQVWMRTAGLPTFRKLYGRNTDTSLQSGVYELDIEYNYLVSSFGGTKSIVISTTSWLGGKNPFLGIAYMAVGSLCIFLGTVFLIKHKVAPRKLGDHTYLSWNMNQ